MNYCPNNIMTQSQSLSDLFYDLSYLSTVFDFSFLLILSQKWVFYSKKNSLWDII